MPFLRNDPELLAAFRQGRRDALERVYRHYIGGIERYARALARAAGSSELAQPGAVADLVQEVFIRAFSDTARRDYDGERDFGRYLTVVARNCFIDVQRSRGREVLIPEKDIPDVADSSGGEDGEWNDPRIIAILARYVEQLPPALRALYEGRYVRGRSQEEVSASLGVSRQTVRTAEKQLRIGLKKALARAGISLREYRDSIAHPSSTKISDPAVFARSRS